MKRKRAFVDNRGSYSRMNMLKNAGFQRSVLSDVLINGKCASKHGDCLLFSHLAPLSHAFLIFSFHN